MAPPHDSDDDEDTDRRQRPTAAELKRHRRTVPGGIPTLDTEPVPESDDPGFEWPVAADHRDAEVLRRANRDPDDPVRPAEISAIVHQLAKRLRAEFSTLLTAIPADIAGRIEKRVEILERDFGPHRTFGKWVAGIAGAALLAVGVFLYHRGQSEQLVTDKLDRLEADIRRLERQHEPQPPTGTRP